MHRIRVPHEVVAVGARLEVQHHVGAEIRHRLDLEEFVAAFRIRVGHVFLQVAVAVLVVVRAGDQAADRQAPLLLPQVRNAVVVAVVVGHGVDLPLGQQRGIGIPREADLQHVHEARIAVVEVRQGQADRVFVGGRVARDDERGVRQRDAVDLDDEALGQLGVVQSGGEALAEIGHQVAARAHRQAVGGGFVDEQAQAAAAGVHGPHQGREMPGGIRQREVGGR